MERAAGLLLKIAVVLTLQLVRVCKDGVGFVRCSASLPCREAYLRNVDYICAKIRHIGANMRFTLFFTIFPKSLTI